MAKKLFSFTKWQDKVREKDQENKEMLQSIQQHPHSEGTQSTKGVSYVFKLLFKETDTYQINFNAFTLDDVKAALYEVGWYLTTDDAEWSNDDSATRYPFNKGNGFHESRFLEWSMDDLLKTSQKFYDMDEDDFI